MDNLILLTTLLLFLCGGCKPEKNAFSCDHGQAGLPCEEGGAADRAKAALKDGNPEAAITILEDALNASPEEYSLVVLLASAYAQKAGLDIFNVVSVGNESGNSSSVFSMINQFVPDPNSMTQEEYKLRIADMKSAKEQLAAIPEEIRADTETYDYANSATYQLTLYTAVYATMYVNQFVVIDPNDPSSIDLSRLQEMSAEDAVLVLENLAAAAASQGGTLGDTINSTITTINSQEGGSSRDQLINYIQASH